MKFAAVLGAALVGAGLLIRAQAAPAAGCGNGLTGVWADFPTDVFAVGSMGKIFHYDGVAWYPMDSGTTYDLHGVWGSSPTDVFAVGEYGKILHYDGLAWSPMPSGTTAYLAQVWGTSPTDVFAVGGDWPDGAILHYDGSVWSEMASGAAMSLRAVWGTSPSDVFAVGYGGTVLHYDGSVWSPLASGTTSWLSGVWGGSPSDVFAVGQAGTILHFDGTVWSPMASGGTDDLHGIWGSSPADVFAVGAGGEFLHYDGSVWSREASGNVFFRGGDVWGTSSSDVFVAGWDNSILHYDGVAWSTAFPCMQVRDIWGTSPSDVFALTGGMILHFDGIAWSTEDFFATEIGNDLWGSSPADVFAVGVLGAIAHFDGGEWSLMVSGTTRWLWAIWGSGPNDVFAVGDGGAILHYDGAGWSPMTSGTAVSLRSVWGTSPSDVFAVGYGGTVLHYDGSVWSPLASGTTSWLSGVWGSSPSDVFAVGQAGTILHYDGAGWSPMDSGTTSGLIGIWGSSPSDLFAVGAGGAILHYDGFAWSPLASGTTNDLYRIWGHGVLDVFIAGDNGTILHLDRRSPPADIALSCDVIAENAPPGATVGLLSTSDANFGDTFTYTLVDGPGGEDNASFEIVGAELRAAATFDFERRTSYGVRVRSTDAEGLFVERPLTITVRDVNEAPRFAPVDDIAAVEGSLVSFVVHARDPDGHAVALAPLALPAGATFDPGTREFRWVPRLDQAGDHRAFFRATDAGSPPLSTDLVVALTVFDPAGPVFADDFADGASAMDWRRVGGAWSASAGAYAATSLIRTNIVRVLPLDPTTFPLGAGVLQARIKLLRSASRTPPNAMLIFAYRDAAHYRWVRLTPTQVRIGQTGNFAGVTGGRKKSVARQPRIGRFTQCRVRISENGTVRVFLGTAASPVLKYRFMDGAVPSVPAGGVGLGAVRAKSIFDDVVVWDGATPGDQARAACGSALECASRSTSPPP